jgi:hypothetical protein
MRTRTNITRRGRLGLILATSLLAVAFAAAAFADDLVTDADLVTTGAQHSRAVSASPGQTKTFAVDLWVECTSKNSHMGASVNVAYSGASSVPTGGNLGATSVTLTRPAGWPSDGTACPSGTLRTAAQTTTVSITAPPSPGTYSYVLQFSSSDADVTTNSSDSRVAITLTVAGKLSQTITFPPISDKTFGDPDFAPGASANSGLPVAYGASGACSLSGGNVHLGGSGSCTITASQGGDATYDPAPDISRSFAIAKAGQTITFAQPASPQIYDSSFAVGASASSGLGVSIVASGGCSYNGMTGLVTMTSGTGSCVLTASQSGNANYDTAADVVRTVGAAKAGQSITFVSPSATYGDSDSPLGATASSGLAVSYVGTTPAICTAVGGDLHIVSAGSCSITANQAGNDDYLAAADVSRTFTIQKASASLTLSGLSKTYTGSPQGVVVETSPAGLSGVAVMYDGSAAEPTDAGSYAVVSSLDNPNYAAQNASGTLDIGQLTVTGGFTTPASKVYDGTASAVVLTRTLENAVAGDDVGLSGGTASFADRSAGIGKVVTLSGASLSGADAHNYLLGSVATATAEIERKPVTGSFDVADKAYDGTTDATIAARSLSGGIPGDDVNLGGGSAGFVDKNVGTDKPVNGIGFILAGADKDNYRLDSVEATTAEISPLGITGSFTAADKTYDGTADATITASSLSGAIAGDDVHLSGGSASFDDKNVGVDKPVTGSGFTLNGADKDNYVLGTVAATSADIGPREVNGSFGADDKVYDGSESATIGSRSLAGAVAGDDVQLVGGSAAFADRNAGADKVVTGTGFALGGSDKDNYSLASSTLATTADIERKPVVGSFEAADKVYDGNAAATITARSLSGGIPGDEVGLGGGSAGFANKHVGTDKLVTGSGFGLEGADAVNYRLDSVGATIADITPLGIGGSFTATDKVYDGTAAATITGRSLDGAISGDDVHLSGGSASFDDKNVGVDKPVTGSGFTLTGTDKDNYTLGSVAATSADITKASLTVTAQDKQKLLNAPNPPFTAAYAGFVNGEGPALLGGSLGYATNVPSPETVGSFDIAPSGLTSSNYAITFVKGKLAIVYRWDGFLQPINDTAHQTGVAESKFKLGSTVPVKFQLKDAAGNAVQSAALPVFSRSARIGPCDPSTLAENVFTDPAFTDTAYRWSQPQYIYNWSTKGLIAGEYRVSASFDDGTKRFVDICLQ